MTRFVDLSHAVVDGMEAYPGLPSPRIGHHLSHEESRSHYEDKAEFLLGRYDLPGNCGTYIDSPFHRHRELADLSSMPLESMAALPGIVIDATAEAGPVRIECDEAELRGRAVLIRTGWDRRWQTPEYWAAGPYVAGAALELLLRAEIALLGVDFKNVDDTDNPARPVHTSLLARGIPVVEHLASLGGLPRTGFKFYAVPPPLVGGASFPVRAFAELE